MQEHRAIHCERSASISGVRLSLDFFATYWVALFIVFSATFAVIGVVIFWRKSDDRMALFASLTLVMFPAAFNSSVLATLPSAWLAPGQIVAFLGSTSLFLFFYLFPDGQFVPRWTRWLTFGVIALWAAYAFFVVCRINFPSLDTNFSQHF